MLLAAKIRNVPRCHGWARDVTSCLSACVSCVQNSSDTKINMNSYSEEHKGTEGGICRLALIQASIQELTRLLVFTPHYHRGHSEQQVKERCAHRACELNNIDVSIPYTPLDRGTLELSAAMIKS